MATATNERRAPGPGDPGEGGATALPRWTRTPVPGTAEYTVVLPGALTPALRRRADLLGVTPAAILLAAHAKVLALLSGESTVRAGLLTSAAAGPLPWELAVRAGTWRQLVEDAGRSLSDPATRPAPPSGFEAVLDPAGDAGPRLPDGAVLAVAAGERNGRAVLRLRHRTDALDADSAARIGGYHLAALERIAADPGAPHDRDTLLSPEEVRLQRDCLAGPHRSLPDRRVHELFEERVRRHPGAVAVVHRDRSWTYRELDVRANRLARALLARDVRPEEVVAVATERDLHWAAAVLGVLKAGAAYLPLDPHGPPDRMTAMLRRAGCRLVLTEPGSTRNPDRALTALPGTRALLVPDVTERPTDGTPPGPRVPAGALAYVFFTSGSTGEPKGAMCEHAGLLNHLQAKIDDLGIGEGTVVAQTASQCFDISLWQLLAALLAGGRTLLVGQDAILDADRFLDTVTAGRAAVVQLVPSYLDVVLGALERRPRELPDLRCVSVTGEELKADLVRRWFDSGPGVRLVNAYGLTETSDDTNHEVMDGPPATVRTPLGRPVQNVRVHVLDEHLAPVPLGAPGTIAFSGVCVGRGYVNDPERTRAAYLPDPHHRGQRLYLSGDIGRWRPDGKLEYLGRADAQVKIRGFRVEPGEVENALLGAAGVRDCAVVVTGAEAHDRQLAAFWAGGPRVSADGLREHLADLLPAYMVPASFHRVESLPLTPNGKTDRKALAGLAPSPGEPGHGDRRPRTPAERRLAAAWADVLGLPAGRIRRDDDFFALGGTSLSAVRLAVSLDRALSPRDLTGHPALADLARLLDARTGTEPAAPAAGP
ncbi:amino acid adenylation domain-containing protein [Streptomyces parvulus]|uniref:amino acid adenylation domain-containing protein n=1 Tax=Streptomyces parvulus TaxID=146923 RepID=UPI0037CE464E